MTPYDQFPVRRQPPPPQRTLPALLLVLLALAVIAGGVYVYRHWFRFPGREGVDPNAQLREVTQRNPLYFDEQTRVEVISRVKPSVVYITTFDVRREIISSDLTAVPAGTGSGFVWDKQGHVVTNYHVIQNADAAQVKLNDGQHTTTYYARVVGAQPDKDIAVLWINAKEDELHPLDLGSSHDLQVGQDVLAIGNPYGLGQTVTRGIVSALGREIESVVRTPIKDVIQTDAPINPGNSGGPLVDSAGRLIGVNTAIYSPSGANAGIGFAIPADEVNQVVTQLIREGNTTTRPRMGVQVASDEVASSYGVKRGALILGVVPGSPAAKAGLAPTQFDRNRGVRKLGDIIVGLDDHDISSADDVFAALANHKAGDTVTLTFVRNGERRQVEVKLQAAS
jgi:S1-C subfamily serine protease